MRSRAAPLIGPRLSVPELAAVSSNCAPEVLLRGESDVAPEGGHDMGRQPFRRCRRGPAARECVANGVGATLAPFGSVSKGHDAQFQSASYFSPQILLVLDWAASSTNRFSSARRYS